MDSSGRNWVRSDEETVANERLVPTIRLPITPDAKSCAEVRPERVARAPFATLKLGINP